MRIFGHNSGVDSESRKAKEGKLPRLSKSRIFADLPGMKKEDIAIDIDGDNLTIKAERKNEHEEKDKSYVRCERSYGSYARSFDISGVKAEGIKASYNDGVLSLTLPKKDVEVSGSRRLAIE